MLAHQGWQIHSSSQTVALLKVRSCIIVAADIPEHFVVCGGLRRERMGDDLSLMPRANDDRAAAKSGPANQEEPAPTPYHGQDERGHSIVDDENPRQGAGLGEEEHC